MYHGIILDLQFVDPAYPEKFKIFAKKKSSTNDWVIYGVEIEDADIDAVISDIRSNMNAGKPYYAHFYNDQVLIVVFKDKVFRCSPQASSWSEVIDYGASIGVPRVQLDFKPCRFRDEITYFKPEDFRT